MLAHLPQPALGLLVGLAEVAGAVLFATFPVAYVLFTATQHILTIAFTPVVDKLTLVFAGIGEELVAVALHLVCLELADVLAAVFVLEETESLLRIVLPLPIIM